MLPTAALALLLVSAQMPTGSAPVSYATAVRAVVAEEPAVDGAEWDLRRWQGPLAVLYAKRKSEPLWFRQGRLTEAGSALLRELGDVEARGLLASDYDGASLAQRATALGGPQAAHADVLAHLDVALSVTAARLASDLHQGRIEPGSIGYDLDVPRPAFDAAATLAALAETQNVRAALDALEPQLRHYLLLKTALARYRAIAKHPELTLLPALPRPRVRPGEPYQSAPALRRLLATLGDLPGQSTQDGEALVLDPALVAALTHFQSRHGLDADGVLGRRTFEALTTPLDARVEQIVLSLERVRWLPERLESPPIIVNIPQFRLFAFRTTQDYAPDILQMNVIVGAAFKARRTPVFAADMSYLVLQPYWDVPQSILVKELLPGIQANPDWVVQNGYEIVQGQGDDAVVQATTKQNVHLLAQGKLRLRQKPGPANALGQVKFMFPNRHNVYLHDTPARALFSRSRRAFSHGCIRVSDPMALLAHVLREDPSWNAERLADALRGTTPVRVPLPKPIRVFILYGTALATEAGETLFFDDIYDQDRHLTALLSSRRTRASAAVARAPR